MQMSQQRSHRIVKIQSYTHIVIIIILLFCFNGCDNSFEPFDEEKGFYSIYGSLNLHADTNFIRVRNLNLTLDEDTVDPLDALVSLTNLDNGSSETLQDSIINFEGVVTHNFYTDMNIQEAASYQVLVDGPGSRSANISTVTPYIADVSVELGNPKEECAIKVKIFIEPVMEMSSLITTMTFRARNKDNNPGTFLLNPEITYTELPQQGLRTKIFSFSPQNAINDQYRNPESDLARVEFGQDPCSVLLSDTFTLNFRHYGPGYDKVISDTVRIPGGEGRFIAYYDSTFRIQVPAISQFIDD